MSLITAEWLQDCKSRSIKIQKLRTACASEGRLRLQNNDELMSRVLMKLLGCFGDEVNLAEGQICINDRTWAKEPSPQLINLGRLEKPKSMIKQEAEFLHSHLRKEIPKFNDAGTLPDALRCIRVALFVTNYVCARLGFLRVTVRWIKLEES